MKNQIVLVLSIIILTFSCSKVPITGRRQLKLLPESELQAMSFDQYNAFLKEHQVVQSSTQAAMVKRVGEKIAAATEQYLQQNKMMDRVDDFKWEFNLVEENTVNAWCMPGGKVVFYTGILPICQDETGVAVVMGHEIAHAIARHGNERMSQGLALQTGATALSVAVANKPEVTQNLFLQAYGLGAQVGVALPFSRANESEADHMGLVFMALAGYDPAAAVDFWQRMAANSKGAPPEFLSTHPSSTSRVEDIKQLLPKIKSKYYKPS